MKKKDNKSKETKFNVGDKVKFSPNNFNIEFEGTVIEIEDDNIKLKLNQPITYFAGPTNIFNLEKLEKGDS